MLQSRSSCSVDNHHDNIQPYKQLDILSRIYKSISQASQAAHHSKNKDKPFVLLVSFPRVSVIRCVKAAIPSPVKIATAISMSQLKKLEIENSTAEKARRKEASFIAGSEKGNLHA